jgi:hypothetical protein
MYTIRLAAAVIIALPVLASASSRKVPQKALYVIAQMRAAAERDDYSTLKKHMTPRFSESVVESEPADTVLKRWKTERTLKTLAKLLAKPCTLSSEDYVECPKGAGVGLRAGFTLHDGVWKLEYLVAGD